MLFLSLLKIVHHTILALWNQAIIRSCLSGILAERASISIHSHAAFEVEPANFRTHVEKKDSKDCLSRPRFQTALNSA